MQADKRNPLKTCPPTPMLTLAIESSCDDTAVAVMNGDCLLASLRSGQEDIHSRFGGVVPELASREHLRAVQPLTEATLQEAGVSLPDIELIAATQGPGLVGSLLVGFSFAKSVAHVTGIPFVCVDHMAGHILSAFLGETNPVFPYISLTVSGGTSAIYLAESFTRFRCLGRTRDDAAGEAFDKVAKLLNLSYPGGPQVSKLAAEGNSAAFKFPRSWLGDSFDFSFSGLKTSVLNQVNRFRQKGEEVPVNDICASFEAAVVEVLTVKALKAALENRVEDIATGGGVSANLALRESLAKACTTNGLKFHAPPLTFCTDNAAMIALAGQHQFAENGACENLLDTDVYSRSFLGQ
ncbi:MAG: tRNA (adenosine(37)-N6)-threonylcarbamoyltransferase complex transferase subunit TsaD [Desulforhopalus sp.]|nr:tRNA (adenosine(37)-N6)-threonylcarbamoyltransferase complex transferase subunit TsaD [Desulforhopalus sp.]